MRVPADRIGDDISNNITSCIMSFPRLMTTDRNHFNHLEPETWWRSSEENVYLLRCVETLGWSRPAETAASFRAEAGGAAESLCLGREEGEEGGRGS